MQSIESLAETDRYQDVLETRIHNLDMAEVAKSVLPYTFPGPNNPTAAQ